MPHSSPSSVTADIRTIRLDRSPDRKSLSGMLPTTTQRFEVRIREALVDPCQMTRLQPMPAAAQPRTKRRPGRRFDPRRLGEFQLQTDGRLQPLGAVLAKVFEAGLGKKAVSQKALINCVAAKNCSHILPE